MAANCNPFIGKPEMVTYLSPPPKPEPGIAIVLVKDGQAMTVLNPGDKAALQQIRWGWWQYELAYRIDVGARTFSFTCVLPSKSSGLDFQAEAHVTYSVANPLAIVQRKITDACAILEPLVTKIMRAQSRTFELNQCDDAEKKICDTVLAVKRLDNFAISNFVVNLNVEDEEREHARRLRLLERNNQYDLKNVEYRQAAEKKYADLRNEILTSNKQFANGSIEQWLMIELLERPTEFRNVLEVLGKHVDGERGHWLEMLKLLNDSKAIAPDDMKEIRDYLIKRYQEIGNKRFG